ncbi:MAG: NlpC/P60 family protein [Leptolyngbyaceae cyanobacterium]
MTFSATPFYRCHKPLNLYDSPALERLATQAARGRWLQVKQPDPQADSVDRGVLVRLCEDGYPGWLAGEDLHYLQMADQPYRPVSLSDAEIQVRIPAVIAFAQAAMATPNTYRWGGTVGPNYDCSGLMQAAFVAAGVWIPRDAYQQEAFAQVVEPAQRLPGDLIFFGTPARATHVGLYLGNDSYLHSSGKDQGRNGIGIDRLDQTDDAISLAYQAQLRGAGRIVSVYQPGVW